MTQSFGRVARRKITKAAFPGLSPPAGFALQVVARDGTQLEEEGCLSVPGFNATVLRPSHAVLKGLDRHGEALQLEGSGLLARAFQHEMDHLDGTLFVDRLRGLKRDIIVRMLNNLLNLAQDDRDLDGTLRYLDTIIAATPEDSGREHGLRALARCQGGDREGALKDLDWVLEKMPEGVNLDVVRGLRQRMSGPGR